MYGILLRLEDRAGSKAASTTPSTAPLPHATTTASPPTAPLAPTLH
jgi:hypothetical protein